MKINKLFNIVQYYSFVSLPSTPAPAPEAVAAKVAQLEKENAQLRKNFSVGTTKTSPSGDTVHIIEEVVRYHGRNSANVLPGWVGYMTDGQIEQVFDEIDADKSGTAIQA